jgi:eukaryotic-like serine/threonine-protein kinase
LDQIGRYKIVGKIGQGGTSHVWKGFDAALDRHVAIKTISADMADDPTLQKRFKREAESAAGLNHPHIITIYDFGQEQDKLYMAMELLEGVDLKQAIGQGRLKSLDDKLEIMSQICDGLAFAHAHDIVHRDLKPANLFLLPDGQVKIMDFGLARVSGSDMTRTGMAMGTPHYMSPEQVRGEHVDFRSDVFALGCVFYEILTGKKPFDADSIHSVLYKVMQEEPKPVRELSPDLPPVLQQVLDKAMAKRPEERFQSAVEFGEVLDRAQEAISTGRGDERLPGLVPPSAAPASAAGTSARHAPSPAASPAGARPDSHHSVPPARRSEGSGSGSRARSLPRASPPPRSLLPLYVAAALGLLTVVGVHWYRSRAGSSSEGSSVDNLMQEVVLKRVEFARKKLESGDYVDAAQRAGEALKLDPGNVGAKEVLAKATEIRDRIEKAVTAARVPEGTAPTEAALAAFWTLLREAPDHPQAEGLAGPFEASMRAKAEEARTQCDAALKKARERPNAQFLEDFKAGSDLRKNAEAEFSKGNRFATAARDFLRARARFERVL